MKSSPKRSSSKPASFLTSQRPLSSSSNKGKKLWGGRFQESTNRLVERFTASVDFDRKLYAYDIEGSIAHCRTLQRAKVISQKECRTIIQGLNRVLEEIQTGRHQWKAEDEDVHMSIERRLTEIVGSVGGKLHTGRSRNDQVTLDLRLYLRDAVQSLEQDLTSLQHSFLGLAKRYQQVIMPGYTHLQRAQPVLFAHHALAYLEMFARDKERLRDALTRINIMPLGSGALAGTNYPLDRGYTASLLNFPRMTQNSLDGVSDRDYVLEVLSVCAILMMHLSRLSEELILWASQEFHFADLPDGYCTGSSMMPQKKNPDIPELVRGKTGRVYGHLFAVLTTLKGLPLSYNRDLQEDKEPLFDTLETVTTSVKIYAELIAQLTVCEPVMTEAVSHGFLLATELADYLVLKGVPFRESHHIVGNLVRECLSHGKDLAQLTAADLQQASPAFDADAFQVLTPKTAINRKDIIGGTATKQVSFQLRRWEESLKAETKQRKRGKGKS
ncbi:MAG: argininosuccinate lyase [Nitrospirales bacterium]|nr:argininosuccinate lyase [Nitrospirales bacterium]